MKKNIIINIYSLKGGGAERVASLLTNELCKNYNVYLVLFDSQDIAYKYSGTLVDLNVKSKGNKLAKCINVIRRTHKLRRFKKNNNIYASISFMESANIVNVLSRYKDKVIISERSHIMKVDKNKYFNKIRQAIYNHSDSIIAISRGVERNLIDNYGIDKDLTTYIHNPIDLKYIDEMIMENVMDTKISKKDFNIINVGRLTTAKGQWHLIRAFTYVKSRITDAKLYILGVGELEKYLKTLIKDLNLESSVHIIGYTKNPFKYMKESNIFVLSSLYEGFGNVIIESMASGTPVISSDCMSGPREIIAPNTDYKIGIKDREYGEYGVLIPTCDGKKYNSDSPLTKEEIVMARSMIELYYNVEKRRYYSKKGKQRVQQFDVKKIASQWEEIILQNGG